MYRLYVACIIAMLAFLTAFDAIADEFVSVGLMNVRRFSHVATLLADGRVLITGGESDDGSGMLVSAEIYDPSTRTFTLAPGSMHTSRVLHAGVLLHDGTVLVVGGLDIFTDPPPPAEIYDPATGTFTEVGRPVTERYEFTAAVTPSGKVVIAGGQGCCLEADGTEFSTSLNSVEIYDPDTRTFTAAAPLSDYRGTAAWAPLDNGGVLIAGGGYSRFVDGQFVSTFLSTADVLDPSTLEFSPVSGSMSVARSFADGALLPDGKVLIAYGGVQQDGTHLPPSAERYDPVTDRFIAAAAPPDDRESPPIGSLPDGRVLFVGGVDYDYVSGTGTFTDTADIYDPAQDTFTTSSATMATTRWLHQATTLDDGSVLSTGGRGLYNVPLIGGDLFLPSSAAADGIFSGEFESPHPTGSIPVDVVVGLNAPSSVCADAHFPPLLERGIVQIMRMSDGTQCMRR